jgi:hypothetical protein
MPQIELSEANGQELRRLLFSSRSGGDTALHEAVLRELQARGAHPPELRNFRAPSESPGAFEEQSGSAGTRPPPHGARAAPGSYEDEFTVESLGRTMEKPPASRSLQPAKLALFGALALAGIGAGGWLAREGLANHIAITSTPSPLAVAPTFDVPAKSSTDPADRAGTEILGAQPAPGSQIAASTGKVEASAAPAAVRAGGGLVIQIQPAPKASTSLAPVRSGASEIPLPAPPPPAERKLVAGQNGGSLRVFVHITDEAQIPTVDRVRSELSGLRFGGQPITMPPLRIVQSSPRRTEVRCLKHADCPAAHRIGRYLAQSLRRPVAVVDMSGRYEQDLGVRPGTLEVWLPQPLSH